MFRKVDSGHIRNRYTCTHINVHFRYILIVYSKKCNRMVKKRSFEEYIWRFSIFIVEDPMNGLKSLINSLDVKLRPTNVANQIVCYF